MGTRFERAFYTSVPLANDTYSGSNALDTSTAFTIGANSDPRKFDDFQYLFIGF